jgi:hypothetical protein
MQIGLLSSAPTQAKSLARLETVAPWLAAASLFVPIALLLVIASMGRYTADDWCWPVYVRERGFFSLQAHMYETSFGRWASTGLLSGVAYLGPWTAAVLPGVGISLWLASMALFWRQVLGNFLPALILAQVTVLGTLLAAPALGVDGVIWQTGMLTYVPPLIVAFAGGTLALRLNSPLLGAVVAFLAAGFNETFMALEVATLAVAFVLSGRENRRLLGWALAGALVSAAIVALSPGNDARRATAETLPLGLIPARVLYRQVVLIVPAVPLALVFTTLAGAGFSRLVRVPRKLSPRWLIGLALALSYVALAPAIYGTNFLAGRAAVTVLLPLVIGAFLLGARLGESVRPRLAASTLILASLAFTGVALVQFLPYVGQFDDYRSELAAQDARLKSTPAGSAVILEDPAVAPYDELWQLRRNPEFLINRCMADYYGLDSLRIP